MERRSRRDIESRAAIRRHDRARALFPFSTQLVDHALVATAALAVYLLLLIARQSKGRGARASRLLFAAGFVSGAAVATNYSAVLDIFSGPEPWVVLELLLLPYRGLFYTSPVLLLSLYGLRAMFEEERRRPDAILATGVFVALLAMNASFDAWHGGGSIGPRYLTPAIPFLYLALVPTVGRLRWLFAPLATAVSPQVSSRVGDPLSDFWLPLFAGQTREVSGYVLRGPVSVHPVGIAGGEIEVRAGEGRFAEWNSFNAGEFWFPRSRVSLVPWLAIVGGGWGWLLLRSGRAAQST